MTHVWLHDMTLESADRRQPIDIAALQNALESCFLVVMRGVAENDGYNALVLKAGLRWRDIALIRALSRYLRQVRLPFSQDYMWATLRAHPAIAAQLVALFQARFDPRLRTAKARAAQEAEIAAEIEAALKTCHPRRGPHPAAFRQCGAVGDPHQFLPDRRGRPCPSSRSRSNTKAAS